jgi:hypothetical protein
MEKGGAQSLFSYTNFAAVEIAFGGGDRESGK